MIIDFVSWFLKKSQNQIFLKSTENIENEVNRHHGSPRRHKRINELALREHWKCERDSKLRPKFTTGTRQSIQRQYCKRFWANQRLRLLVLSRRYLERCQPSFVQQASYPCSRSSCWRVLPRRINYVTLPWIDIVLIYYCTKVYTFIFCIFSTFWAFFPAPFNPKNTSHHYWNPLNLAFHTTCYFFSD